MMQYIIMFDTDGESTDIFEEVQALFPRRQNPYFINTPKITDFQKIRYIASGAFGKVQQYYSPQKKQYFAIKRMKFDGREDLKNIREIKRQLDILYKINSPYLVKLYDHFEEESLVYLIMQYIEGNNLYECIFKPKIQLQMNPICKIIYEICQGLEELHKLKIIHRDLKLQNLLLTKGAVKIIDLGQSNHYGEGIDRFTKRGTKSYFCPEIINREQQDDRIDSWCLGVILYELLCMASPFMDATDAGIEQKIRRFNYPIPERIKYEKELLDLFSKIFTWKSERIRIPEIKNHPFIKKYLNDENHSEVRFENTFSQQQIVSYRTYLESEIDRYKDSYKQIIEQNKKIEDMIEKTKKKIFGLSKLM